MKGLETPTPVYELTEGIPFFLEESVRTLVETEVLVGERGAYRMAKALEALQIPATAQAILAARIDRLPTEEKRLLQSAEVLSRVAEAMQGDRRYEWLSSAVSGSVGSRARLAWCLAELGEFAEAMARGEEAVRMAREVDDFSSLIFAYRSLGFVCRRRGALPQAIPLLGRAVELCRVAHVRYLFDITAAHLGYAYALSARLPEGVILIEEALADPVATAEAHFGAAMALASELGMRPLVAHCHLGLGKLYGRTGDRVTG